MLDIKKIKSLFATLRQAFSGYKKTFLLLVVLGFFVAFFEGLGVTAVIPLFAALLVGSGSSQENGISHALEEVFLWLHVDFTPLYIIVTIVALFVVRAMVLLLSSYIQVRLVASYEVEIRSRIFYNTVLAKWSALSTQRIGQLENTIMVDVSKAAELLRQVTSVLMMLVSLLVYTIVALKISTTATLLVMFSGVGFLLVFKPLISKTRKVAGDSVLLNKEVTHFVNQCILGMKTVKASGLEELLYSSAKDLFEKARDFRVRLFLLKNVTGILLQPILVLVIACLFFYALRNPGFNIASLVVIAYLLQKMFTYFNQINSGLHHINENIPYLQYVAGH